jgi:NAD+ kinase
MFKSFNIIAKLNSENDLFVQRVLTLVRCVLFESKLHEKVANSKNLNHLVVAIGGDGTMLEAIRCAALTGSTAVGINLGRVGFLTDIGIGDHSLTELASTFKKLLQGQLSSFQELRTVLTTSVQPLHKLAANEVTVSQLYADSMITYRLTINNFNAGIHRANAIMVATATGSTAYSLSAGGALMMPDIGAIQVVPVAPLTMTSRPIVVSSRHSVKIEAWGGPISVRFDGQRIDMEDQERVYTREHPYEIVVSSFEYKASILHLEDWNFFNILTEKLGWIKE